MIKNYKLLFTFLFLFTAGIMSAQINANFTSQVAGGKVIFTNNTTSNPSSSTLSFSWDFGDGSTIFDTKSNNTFNHDFSQTGTYTVTLIAIDSSGTLTNDTFSAKVDILCKAKFSYVISGFNIDFKADSSIGNYATFYWNFGTSTSTLRNPKITVNNLGFYHIRMNYYDSTLGCGDSVYHQVTISSNPCYGTAAFGYNINSANNVDFMADSSIRNSASFEWNFGDGNLSNQRNPNHTFTLIGNYNVKMIYVDSTMGCKDSITKTVNISISSCNAHFKFTIQGDSVTATADTNTSFMSHTWSAGGNIYTGNSIKVYFPATTVNIICHQLIDSAKGCSSSWCDTVSIKCNLDFTYVVSGDTLKTTNTSVMPPGTTYYWNYGDGKTSSGLNTKHVYSVTDTIYNVKLSVSNSPGCNGTIYKQVLIGNIIQNIVIIHYKDSSKSKSNPCYAKSRIYLIKYDVTNLILTAIDSADIKNDTAYVFKRVHPGKYLIKAALLPTDYDYYNYLPTYADTSLLWSDAKIINHDYSNTSYGLIHYIKGTNPGGSGFIAGYVYQGANKKEGTLENIDVYLLLKDGTPVTYAKTDVEGKYEFNNLAFGAYKIRVEIFGKTSEEYDVFIDQNSPSAVDNNFDVNKYIVFKRNTLLSVNSFQNNNFKIYPNPVNDFLNIELENDAENIDIEIYDISGSLVLKNKINSNEKIDVSNIKTGIYFIQIQTENLTIHRQKFLKD